MKYNWFMVKDANIFYNFGKKGISTFKDIFFDSNTYHSESGWTWSLSWGYIKNQYDYFNTEKIKFKNSTIINPDTLEEDMKKAVNDGIVRPGDIIYFFTNSTIPDHVAFVVDVTGDDIVFAGHTNHTSNGSVYQKVKKAAYLVEIISLDDVLICS